MKADQTENQLILQLSNEEAIIFYNWIANFNQKEHELFFEDQSEQRILWDMEAELEKVIPIVFNNNYHEFLFKAKQKLKDDE